MTLVSVSGSLTTMIQVDMMWLSSTLSIKKLLVFMTCVPISSTNPLIRNMWDVQLSMGVLGTRLGTSWLSLIKMDTGIWFVDLH